MHDPSQAYAMYTIITIIIIIVITIIVAVVDVHITINTVIITSLLLLLFIRPRKDQETMYAKEKQ